MYISSVVFMGYIKIMNAWRKMNDSDIVKERHLLNGRRYRRRRGE